MDLYEIAEKLEEETDIGVVDDLIVAALTQIGWHTISWDAGIDGQDAILKALVPPKVELVWYEDGQRNVWSEKDWAEANDYMIPDLSLIDAVLDCVMPIYADWDLSKIDDAYLATVYIDDADYQASGRTPAVALFSACLFVYGELSSKFPGVPMPYFRHASNAEDLEVIRRSVEGV